MEGVIFERCFNLNERAPTVGQNKESLGKSLTELKVSIQNSSICTEEN